MTRQTRSQGTVGALGGRVLSWGAGSAGTRQESIQRAGGLRAQHEAGA